MTVRFAASLCALVIFMPSCAWILGLDEPGDLAATSGGSAGSSMEPAGAGGDSGAGGTDGGGGEAGCVPGLSGLDTLSVSSGVLEQLGDDYHLRVGLSVAELRVTPVAENPCGTILVNDEPVLSGQASQPIPLGLSPDTSTTTTITVVTDSGTPDETSHEIEVERASGLFDEEYLKASNLLAHDHFGASVSLSQGTLVVGAPLQDGSGFGVDSDQFTNTSDNSGAAYVFVKTGVGAWTQQAFLKASNPHELDRFGAAVAISGDVLVVGAPGESSEARRVNGEMNDTSATSSGAAYVFHRVAGHWAQRAYLKPSANAPGNAFGASVAISGDTIVVGAPEHVQPMDLDSAGAAYIFERVGDDWLQSYKLAASNPASLDQFGASVAISGGRIVVGAPGESSAGAAYIFEWNETDWGTPTFVKASDNRPSARFGSAVTIDGGLVGVGAPALESGAVYLFENQGEPGSWEQTAIVKASNAETGDTFGSAAALGQGVLAVAAGGSYYGQLFTTYGEDSGAVGINGEEMLDDAKNSGAVYLFAREGNSWAQQAYVKPSNTQTADHFGSAVAVADGELAVGAALEDGNAVGDPTDNEAPDGGAVYVRSLLALPPDSGAGARGLTELQIGDQPVALSSDRFDYQVTVAADAASVPLTALAADPGAEITVTDLWGNVVESVDVVQPSADIVLYPDLYPGDNRLTVHVVATSGEYVNYTVDVRRPIPVTEAVDDGSPLHLNAGQVMEAAEDNSMPVAISGDTLVVGLPNEDLPEEDGFPDPLTEDSGAVRVFVRKAAGWEPEDYLKASNAAAFNKFGASVAIDGNTLVVGAPGEASASDQDPTQDPLNYANAGAAYVFVRSGAQWQEKGRLKAYYPSPDAEFGCSVAIDGESVVVGARGDNDLAIGAVTFLEILPSGAPRSGAAQLFVRDATYQQWFPKAYLKPTNTHSDQRFGTRVAIFGDTIAVTASDDGGGSSTIYGEQDVPNLEASYTPAVFTFRFNGKWQSESYIKAPNYHIDTDFGRSLALGQDILVVGATGDQNRSGYVNSDEFDALAGTFIGSPDEPIPGQGAVYVFERANGLWHKTAYLKASDAEGLDSFGRSVSLAGDYLAIGAPRESSSLPGNPDDNQAQLSGAAYLFYRSPLGWSQASYVKATDITRGVGFGCFVALDDEAPGSLVAGNCWQADSPVPMGVDTFAKVSVFQFEPAP